MNLKRLIWSSKDYIYNYYDNNGYERIIKILIIFTCIYSSFVLLVPGIPMGHDLTFHLSRILGIRDGLLAGEFPIKIYPNYLNGYGYGNGLFYSDIFLYIPAVLCLLGIKVVNAYKIFLFICTVFTTVSIYICVKCIFKSKFAGTISMIIYTLSSYRMVDMYIRAALGEVLAFIFLPIIVLGVYKIIYEDYREWYILSIGFSGLVLSHNISSIIMFIFVAIMILINFKKFIREPKRLGFLILSTVISILLVSYYLFPMLEQLVSCDFVINTGISANEVWKSTLPILKIIFSIPYSVFFLKGISGIGVVFFVIIFLNFKRLKNNVNSFTNVCLVMGIISILAVTRFFPWKIIIKYLEQISVIQFSWRLHLFSTLFISISAGGIILKYRYKREIEFKTASILIFLSIVSCSVNMFTQYLFYGYSYFRGFYEVNIESYSIGLGEYLPANTDKDQLMNRGDIIVTNDKNINYDFFRDGTTLYINFNNNINKNTYLEVPLLYYLGYEAEYINGSEKSVLPISKGENGVVKVDLLNYEDGNITIKYTGTNIQVVSQYISAITFIIFIGILIKDYKRRESVNEKIIYNNTNV